MQAARGAAAAGQCWDGKADRMLNLICTIKNTRLAFVLHRVSYFEELLQILPLYHFAL